MCGIPFTEKLHIIRLDTFMELDVSGFKNGILISVLKKWSLAYICIKMTEYVKFSTSLEMSDTTVAVHAKEL